MMTLSRVAGVAVSAVPPCDGRLLAQRSDRLRVTQAIFPSCGACGLAIAVGSFPIVRRSPLRLESPAAALNSSARVISPHVFAVERARRSGASCPAIQPCCGQIDAQLVRAHSEASPGQCPHECSPSLALIPLARVAARGFCVSPKSNAIP